MPATLRGRLALTYAGLTVILLFALGFAIMVAIRDLFIDRLTTQLTDQARMTAAVIGPSLADGSGPDNLDALVKRIGAGLDSRLTIVDGSGRVLADSAVEPASPRLSPVDAATSDRPAVARQGSWLIVAIPAGDGSGIQVQASASVHEIDAAVGRVRRDVFGVTMLGAAVAAIVAVFIARRINGPLDLLRQHAAAVSAGRLDVTTPPVAPRELADLARSFNAMTARLKELAAESERSRTRLEAIFANLTDGVVILDESGTVLGLNDAATAMLGTNPVWAVGHPFLVVVRDHDLLDLMRRAFTSGEAAVETIEYARSGRVLEAAAQPVAGPFGRFGIVVLHDVTELRRLEAVRKEFVANVSHELRTPLASIRAVVETLEAGAMEDPDVAGDFLRRIVGEIERLTSLVDDLLDLARLESGRIAMKLEAIPAADLVRRGAERLRPQTERARLTLEIDAGADLPLVVVDRARIEQALLNLIHNAIKFTPAGGVITVSARAADDEVRVSVKDTGVGIHEPELGRVFERFYKADRARSSDGTGLGLAITKHIVQAHHGRIDVDSAPGAGATFTFTLPLAPAGMSARSVIAEPALTHA